jgi:hypothetical protein
MGRYDCKDTNYICNSTMNGAFFAKTIKNKFSFGVSRDLYYICRHEKDSDNHFGSIAVCCLWE